ncbi:MAG: CAP domain-containing protein [Actinomycetota bacterium]
MRTKRGVVTLAASALVVSGLGGASQVAAGECWTYKAPEKRMARTINRARTSRGHARLTLDRHLSRVARAHTKAMINRRSLFHTADLGRKVTRWSSLGENVGYGASVRSLHRAFMRSPGHRNNVLGRFRHVGIATGKAGGRMWITVIFEHRRNPGTRLSMPRC